jgi:hypothetical protein
MQQQEEQRKQWREVLAAHQESGQSIVAFCRERGVREWQFHEWKKRLRAQTESFVAVELVATVPTVVAASGTPTSVTPLEVRLRSGRSVLVGSDFEANHLRRLLQVLEPEA